MTRSIGLDRAVRTCGARMLKGISLLALLAAAPVDAQESAGRGDTVATRPLCWRGRPLPQCQRFVITEVAYHRRLAGTSYQYQGPSGPNGETATFTEKDLGHHFSWELGVMQNVSRTAAAGGTLMLGTGDGGARVALKGRYRHWIDDGEARIDLAAGGIRGYLRPPIQDPVSGGVYPSAVPAYGVTADATFDVFDLVGVSARVELMRARGHTGSAVYGGVRLGSYPAAVASAAAGAGLIYLIWALSQSN